MATAANKKRLKGRSLKSATKEFFNGKTVEGFSYSHEQVGGEDVYKLSLTSNVEKTVEAVIKGPQGFLDRQASLIPLFLEGVTADRICVCEEDPFTGMAIHYTNTFGKEKMFRLMVERSFVGKVSCEVFLREEMSTPPEEIHMAGMKDLFIVPQAGSLVRRVSTDGAKLLLSLTSRNTLVLNLPTATAAEDLKSQIAKQTGTPLLKKVRTFEDGGKYMRLYLVLGAVSCSTSFGPDGVSPDSITLAFAETSATHGASMKRSMGQPAYA